MAYGCWGCLIKILAIWKGDNAGWVGQTRNFKNGRDKIRIWIWKAKTDFPNCSALKRQWLTYNLHRIIVVRDRIIGLKCVWANLPSRTNPIWLIVGRKPKANSRTETKTDWYKIWQCRLIKL